ncbi:MAG: hypothetical protein JW953_05395 [Anaerolineae bacterium]|nr:hypothetical protein [Anaerolineae bacterium]
MAWWSDLPNRHLNTLLAEFRAATGQEQPGFNLEPGFTNASSASASNRLILSRFLMASSWGNAFDGLRKRGDKYHQFCDDDQIKRKRKQKVKFEIDTFCGPGEYAKAIVT